MPLSRIYVQGTELKWEDNNTTFKLTGAIPGAGQEAFSGQPSGRMWVAQSTNAALTASYLYYSDYVGQTRMVAGIRKISASSAAPGRITSLRSVCAQDTASQLYWAGTNNWWMMARSEGVLRGRVSTLTVAFSLETVTDNQVTGSVSLAISNDLYGGYLNYPITVKDFKIETYTDTVCANATTFSSSLTSITVPAENNGGTISASLMFTTGSTSNYYKIVTASVQVGTGSIFVSRSGDEIFCHLPQHNTAGYSGPGPDVVSLYFAGACTVLPDGGAAAGTAVCGAACHPLSSSASERCKNRGTGTPGFNDCYDCTVQWNSSYMCTDPAAGGYGGDCDTPCTVDAECTGPCNKCVFGGCGVAEPT